MVYGKLWQLKHVIIFFLLVLTLFFYILNKNYSFFANSHLSINSNFSMDSNLSINYFVTAKGKKPLDDIVENVFQKFGYAFIKNDLIPVLKKTVSMKCEEVFSEWQKIALNAPKDLLNPETFLLNNYSALSYVYQNDIRKNKKTMPSKWDEKLLAQWIKIAKSNPLGIPASYSNESLAVYFATKYFNIKEKIGAVIGTQVPWAEAYVLANGAKHVTTVDYQKIIFKHPKLNFVFAQELPNLQKIYNNYFDFIVSFSSIEHSGLGRYGDPIDPIGDIREMHKIYCMLKPSGLLFFAVPIGQDSVVYNAHRIYGRMRLAMMFEGFELLKVFYGNSDKPIEMKQDMLENGFSHYVFVLRKLSQSI